jgi:phage major head subunit gpT-like protein
VTAGVQRNYWNDLDLTAGNIVVVRDAMKAYKGENGIRLGIRPTIL